MLRISIYYFTIITGQGAVFIYLGILWFLDRMI